MTTNRLAQLLVLACSLAACGGGDAAPDAGPESGDAAATPDAAHPDATVDATRPRIDGGPIPEGVPDHIVAATPGEWTEIGENTLADVAFDYGAAATPDGFRQNLQGLMDAWSGAAYASARHRLYLHGGGHRDYDGNEWYAFDVHAARWERVNDPSLYLETEAVGGVFPDGAPVPIHTYDCLVYAPTTDTLYRMNAGGSPLARVFAFDLTSATWRDTGAEVTDPFGGTARWDPIAQQILLLQNARHAAGYAHVVRFDPATDTRTQVELYGPTMRTITGTMDTAGAELVFVGAGLAPIRVSTSSGASTPTATTGDTRLEAVGGPGFAYDARRDRFTGWGAGDARTLFHLSKADWTWTTETPATGATPSAANTNGVFGRFQYVPEYDVFVLATTVSGPVMMWKPADWAPPG